jgi:hypothetical protein
VLVGRLVGYGCMCCRRVSTEGGSRAVSLPVVAEERDEGEGVVGLKGTAAVLAAMKDGVVADREYAECLFVEAVARHLGRRWWWVGRGRDETRSTWKERGR